MEDFQQIIRCLASCMHTFRKAMNVCLYATRVCAMKCKMLRNVFVHLLLLIANEMVRSTLPLTFGCWKSKGRGSIWTNFAKSNFGEFWFCWAKFLKSADQKLCLRLNLHTISLIVIDKVSFYWFVAWWSALQVSTSKTDFRRKM